MIPYQDPTPTWPVGYRRAKDSGAWIMQGIWGLGSLAGLVACASSGFPLHGVLLLLAGLFSVVWIEFEARCEDRGKVLAIFGGMMALMALWAASNRNDRQE